MLIDGMKFCMGMKVLASSKNSNKMIPWLMTQLWEFIHLDTGILFTVMVSVL